MATAPAVNAAEVEVEFRCPNSRCRRFLFIVLPGTRFPKVYCWGCRSLFLDQVAR